MFGFKIIKKSKLERLISSNRDLSKLAIKEVMEHTITKIDNLILEEELEEYQSKEFRKQELEKFF